MAKPDNRVCKVCGKPLVRRSVESDSRFEKRKTCANDDGSRSKCSIAANRAASKPKRVAAHRSAHVGENICDICGKVIVRKQGETNCDYMKTITCRSIGLKPSPCALEYRRKCVELRKKGLTPEKTRPQYNRDVYRAEIKSAKKAMMDPAPVRKEVSLTQLLAWKKEQEAIERESRDAYQRMVNTPLDTHYRHNPVLSYLFA